MAALDQQELLRDFPDVTESDLASEFLHAYLTPEARKNISLELCARILLTEPELHEKLKEGHKSQNSEALDNLCAYLRRNAWRFQPQLEEMNELLREIFSDGRITLIAKGEWKGPSWMPPKNSSKDAHIDPETTAYIENLRIPFQHNDKLRNRLDRVFSSSKDTFLVNTSGDSFYIAIDEANVASRKHDEAFEDQHGRYPILKEIIRGLRRQIGSSKIPIRFVVAGTMIPEDHFQSTVGEWDDFRWCSDTGSFNDPEDHRRYVSQFMPDSFSSSVTGQALIARMWYWLRGRHRYTASFLAVLLRNNYQSPHTLLGGRNIAIIIGIHHLVPQGFSNGHLAWSKCIVQLLLF
ncbi:hypothetical protein LENED_010193 [Lentinula edodes]|uniref:Uncharacterized protein n=1 Tax=Lentinula edodes TaxID=5353 RepID=A0A1Q3ELQ9_LENED|nr:hypothetical protein LENED_010193 [Lentinula edodes]